MASIISFIQEPLSSSDVLEVLVYLAPFFIFDQKLIFFSKDSQMLFPIYI